MGDGVELRARVEGGVLQVARYEGNRQTEEWREPYAVKELAGLLPTFTKNALADALADGSETRDMLTGIGSIVDKVITADAAKSARQPRGAPFDEDLDAPVFDEEQRDDIFGGGRRRTPADEIADVTSRDFGGGVRRHYPSNRANERAGAQFVPHLRAGGVVVAPDALDKLEKRELVLRFSHNTYLPEVAEHGGGQPATEWRQPTQSEAKLFGDVTPLTSAAGMVALFRLEEDVARFVGFTLAEEVVDVGGMRERVAAGFFDTLCDEQMLLGAPNGVLLSGDPSKGGPFCIARLFTGKNVGDPARSNMVMGGCFPADNTMMFKRIVAEVRLAPGFIGEARKAVLAAVRAGLSPRFIIGCKPFPPAACVPVDGADDNGARYEYPVGGDVGIALPARQNFSVDVDISKAAYEILTIPGSRVRIWVEGTLCRDVQ